jgi:stress response protein SCP2
MKQLSRGERLPLGAHAPDGVLQAGLSARALALDFACFALDASGKLLDERYMTFFNQPASPCGGVRGGAVGADKDGFSFDLGRLPAAVERVVITASIDGSGVMSELQSGYLRLLSRGAEFARFDFTGQDFAAEQAVMLGELYRKDGQWRFMAVGQGFNGGLAALVGHFGADVAQAPQAAAPAPAAPPAPAKPNAPSVSLEKRVEQAAPQLVSLVKSAGVSLAKVGLEKHRAKVCLVLDISGSMSTLYRKGLVQGFAERILALGCRFDDDGEIDVFLFGRNVHRDEPMGLDNWSGYVGQMIARHPLEGDTRYGAAMEAVRRHYFPDAAGGERRTPCKSAVPVYVMFVTDGTTSDKPLTERQLRWASREAIFWQFMGIGKGKKSKSKLLANFAESDFPFLEKLDELDGRLVDNADFFSVASPDEHSEAELYDLLMTEYPAWLKQAAQHGLLA